MPSSLIDFGLVLRLMIAQFKTVAAPLQFYASTEDVPEGSDLWAQLTSLAFEPGDRVNGAGGDIDQASWSAEIAIALGNEQAAAAGAYAWLSAASVMRLVVDQVDTIYDAGTTHEIEFGRSTVTLLPPQTKLAVPGFVVLRCAGRVKRASGRTIEPYLVAETREP